MARQRKGKSHDNFWPINYCPIMGRTSLGLERFSMHKSSLKARLLQIRLSTLLIATFIAAWLLFVNVRAKNEIHEYRPSCGGAPQQISLENERGWPLTFSAQLRALDEFTSIEPNELLNGKYLAFDAAISFSIVVLLAAATEAFFRYYETRKNW